MRSLSFSLPLIAGALAACGGKVFIDVSSGSTGSGGGGEAGASSSSASSASSSSSSSSSGEGGAASCPDPFPGIEAPCKDEGMTCPVPNACCNGDAVCKGGLWTFLDPLCDGPCEPQCGPNGFACATGFVCAVFLSWTTVYSCEPSGCVNANLSCGCASEICEDKGFVCNNTSDFQVYCDCPNC